MTLVELSEMMEAFTFEEQRIQDVENQRVAWQTAMLMNATGNYRKRINPIDLYKPIDFEEDVVEDQQVVERFESNEQKEDYIKNLMKKFGKE